MSFVAAWIVVCHQYPGSIAMNSVNSGVPMNWQTLKQILLTFFVHHRTHLLWNTGPATAHSINITSTENCIENKKRKNDLQLSISITFSQKSNSIRMKSWKLRLKKKFLFLSLILLQFFIHFKLESIIALCSVIYFLFFSASSNFT